MKRYLLYGLLLLIGFYSCKKGNDPVFDESPDERITKELNKIQAGLLSAPDGWKATIVPVNGATYHYYFRFNNANRVFMRADFDTATAATTGESSYRLKALQQPSLLFDTYSYLHMLSDPDASVNGGYYGAGLVYDFEFAVDTVTADSIVLTGRFHGSHLVLRKASAQDRQEWENQSWAHAVSLQNAGNFDTYFTRLTWGSTQYDIQVDPYNRQLAFYYYNSASTVRQRFITPYIYTSKGVEFTKPFTAGAEVLGGFTNMGWDSLTNSVTLRVNGVSGNIQSANAPVKVDLNGPARWRQLAISYSGYWASAYGFTKSWNYDALGLLSIPNYYYMIYYPRFGATGTVVYDFGGIAYVNANNSLSVYGPTFSAPVAGTDGKMIFTALGTYGTAPSANSVNIMYEAAGVYTEAAGYYFVQTGAETFDMVSAKDARTWISWELLY